MTLPQLLKISKDVCMYYVMLHIVGTWPAFFSLGGGGGGSCHHYIETFFASILCF